MAKLATRKRAVNLSIDSELAAEAKELGTNLSAVLERALRAEHRERRQAKWINDNRTAMDAWNRLIEEEGLWAEKYRS